MPADAMACTSLNVLVVDDNLLSAQVMSDVLRNLGHRPRTASGGAHAIQLAMAEGPDVVLMDLRMPDVDGYEAARRIKTLMPDVIMVAISGAISPQEAARARAAGFEVQLPKPITPERLREVLDGLFPDRGR
jgi:CheY-like chemotaxis protein